MTEGRYSESTLCPFCGADSSKHCGLEEESGGECPWEEMVDDRDEKARRDDAPTDGFSPLGRALVDEWFGDEEAAPK